MSSIDERVVEAKFDNKQFEQGVKQTTASLNNLKQNLNMDGATRGLSGLGNAASTVANKFNVMRVAVYTAVATIAHQLTIAGEQLVKSFTVGPLIDGLHEYETQLNSVQTILSNTQWEHKNLDDVNGALNELNHYSDKTIYNFSEMARNVGTFTAAGVGLDKSVASIKGIANLAAVSGSNSQQAATAMYQLSQAISSGTVKLMDWNSVVNAGMGGKVFQDALKETARIHGVNIDAMIKKEGSFRNTLQNGWLTSKILTQTLKNFTGDVSREQLKQMGYTEKQIDGIIKMGKTATDAATKVKTFTQLMGTLREAAGSGWAKTWQLIIGNFNQAKKVWTSVSDTLGGMLQHSAKVRNNLLKEWASLGGRKALIDGISNAFHALMSILDPIRDAFREIFPRKTAEQLVAMTESFRDLMAKFKIGADTANTMKRIFAGVFAVFDIGWQLIKATAHFLADLIGTVGKSSGGIADFAARIGDLLVGLDKALKKGQGFTKFFDGIENMLKPLISTLGFTRIKLLDLMNGILNAFSETGKILPKVKSVFQKINDAIHSFLGGIFSGFHFENFLNVIDTGLFAGLVLLVRKFVNRVRGPSPLQTFVEKLTAPFKQLTDTLKAMQQALQAAALVEIAIAVGLLTASVFTLSKIDSQALTKALSAMSVMFGQLVAALFLFNKVGGAKGLFTTSAGLILFATAIRVLTSSVKALAELSWGQLSKGLVGVTGLIAGLIVATKGIGGNAAGMIRAGAGLLLLSAGIKVLASAMADISKLSWGQMAKGLAGVAATLVALALFTKIAEVDGAGIRQGAGLILLAASIKMLADAAAQFAELSWGQLSKGLVSIGAILTAFTIFTKTVGKSSGLISAGLSLVAIAAAMKILASALADFAKMSWGQITKGIVVLAGAMTILTVAMRAMNEGVGGAASMLVIAAALRVLAPALKSFGDMDWENIAKAMVVLAGSLTLMVLAIAGAEEGLPGAAAIFVMAAAMKVLAPVLQTFGNMSWGEIVKGLVLLAGSLLVFGGVAAVLTEVIPSMFGLAASVALLGVGVYAVGVGVSLLGAGLVALATGATAVLSVLESVLSYVPKLATELGIAVAAIAVAVAKAAPDVAKAIIAIIDAALVAIDKEGPKMIKTFGKIIVALVRELADAIPKISASALKMMIGIIDAIDKKAPTIVHKISNLIVDILHAMTADMPKIVAAGVELIASFLEGIAKNVGKVVKAGADIIIAWINGISDQSVRIVNAAFKAVIKFINGLADAIEENIPQLRDAGKHLAFAIADGMTLGLASKVKDVAGKAKDLANSALGAAHKVLGVFSPSKKFRELGKWSAIGFALGIDDYAKLSEASSRKMANDALKGATREFKDAVKAVIFDLPKGLVGGKDEVLQTIHNTHDALHAASQRAHQDMQQLKQDLHDLKANRDDDNKAVRDASEAVDENTKKLHELQNAKKQDHDAIVQAQHDLRDSKEKLDDAKKAQKDHEQAIKDDTAALEKATLQYQISKDAFDTFNQKMDAHKEKLIELGKQYDKYTTKINTAEQALQSAISTEQNYNDQIVQQYSDLPDISADTSVTDYTDELSDQVDNTQKFIDDLNTLRDQFGLSDELYKELLAKGPAILPFVDQLVAGGQAAVDQLNTLTAQLDTEAKTLGTTASKSLYQAGVDAAQGLLDGLESKRDKIEKKMEHIANIIAKAIRKALKIKSPSQIMAEIGQFVVQGLVDGMSSMEGDIDKQGNKLIKKMNDYIQQLNNLLKQAEAISPRITPVLDLSQVQKDAARISSVVAAKPISVNGAFSTASQAAAGVQNVRSIVDAIQERPTSTQPITFIQNNTSPKALSSADIYRQTNNQISLAKGALTTSATKIA